MEQSPPNDHVVERFNMETKTMDALRIAVGPDHFYTVLDAGLHTFPDAEVEELPAVGEVLYDQLRNCNAAMSAVKVVRVTPKTAMTVEIMGTLAYHFEDIKYGLGPHSKPVPCLRLVWTPAPDRVVPGTEKAFRRNDCGHFHHKGRILVRAKPPSTFWPLKTEHAAK